ncbi:Uncharacterised protein [Leclercia adecarboxylata]|nr:Uncharacterised protein [Leclercia adecarboxylata]
MAAIIFFYGFAQLRHKRLPFLFRCLRDENGKLISSQPCNETIITCRVLQYFRKILQGSVPFGMPVSVVDKFEIIKINNDQAKCFVIPDRFSQYLISNQSERTSVTESSQCISCCLTYYPEFILNNESKILQ